MSTRTRHRLDVAEYEEMVATGILGEDDRVELIRGEILEKMTLGDRHAAAVNRLVRVLSRRISDEVILSLQNPIRLTNSVPEPDVCLLRARDDFYASGKPTGADVLLVIEVADTSLPSDRDEKAPLYAEAGIPEYWIVNLTDACLERHTDPDPARGLYTLREILTSGHDLRPAAFPMPAITVAEILPA